MSKSRLVITAVVVEGRSPSEVARTYGVGVGVGDAVVSDDGAVSITGTGAPADPSAPTADSSIEAQITAC